MKPAKTTYAKQYRLILSAVHMVYRLVNSTYNVREMSLRLTRLLCQFIKANSASIHILDPEKKKLKLIALYNNKINILHEKQKDLKKVTPKEKKVTAGYSVFEKRFIGLPLVAEDNVGAVFIARGRKDPEFTEFDRDMLAVFAEQSVTAMKNLQLYEQQQRTILSSIRLTKNLLEKKGHWLSTHTPDYFNIVKSIAEQLKIGEEGIENLYYASILHDAGAIDVPYEILSKTSQLSSEEFKVIRDLPAKSVDLIRPVEFLKPVLPIILYHHEQYDGSGYPSGLKKEQIPLGARIMAVVDAFEAMTRGRPYRQQLSIAEAISELMKNSGTQFDPKVVAAFQALSKRKKFRNCLSKIKG
ncbi:MAG: HD domain-containing protein [Candidatus Omnitrophica bacterium]|nr:HD domain-containing protein [Candidatus Omnitrophota bacterium]